MKIKSFFAVLFMISLTYHALGQWSIGTYGINYNSSGKSVAIGNSGTPSYFKLCIQSDFPYGIYNINTYSVSATKYGIYSTVSGGTTTTYGLYSSANSSNGNKFGIYSIVSGNGDKYGIYSECVSGTTGYPWAGYFKNGTVEIDHGDLKIGGQIPGGINKKFSFTTQFWLADPHSLFIIPLNGTVWDNSKAFEFTDDGILKVPGRIGIGTTNPLTDFQVNGSASIGYESVLPSLSKSLIVSGNVGIGTYAPTTKLDVIGKVKTDSLQVIKGFNTGYVLVSDYRGNAIWTDPTTVDVGAWIRNGNNIYVATDKKIGIGTVTPAEPLHVIGNALISGAIKGGHTDWQPLALYGNSSTTDGSYMYMGNNGTGSDGSIKLCVTGANSNIEFTNKNMVVMNIRANNDIVIGNPNQKANMYVNGDIQANLVRVNNNGWWDCVFEKDYKLQPLSEVEKYINQNKHLPEIPTDAEVKANGIDVAQINALLLKKVEELTLYVIELEKRVNKISK